MINHIWLHVLLVVVSTTLVSPQDQSPRITIYPDGKPVVPAPMPSPAPIPTSAVVSGDRFELLVLQNAPGPVTWDVTSPTAFQVPVELFEKKPGERSTGWRMGAAGPAQYPIGDTPTVEVYATGDGAATVAAWGVQNSRPVKLATFQVTANRGPQPPPKPDPDPPGPKPDPQPPTPAKSFRVIFAVESGDVLTPAQQGVIYGVTVENWCLKNCTGGKDGFRRRDKDNPNVTGAELNAIWQTARPLITRTPCAIVEKNTHIEIIPIEATPEKMVAVFQEYLDGKRGK
jgi:hypothetical protein